MTVRLDVEQGPIPGQIDLFELLTPAARYVPGDLDEQRMLAVNPRRSWFSPEPQDNRDGLQQWQHLMAGPETCPRYGFNGWRAVPWEHLVDRPRRFPGRASGTDAAGELYVADLACRHWRQATPQKRTGPPVCQYVSGWNGVLYAIRCCCDRCGAEIRWTRVHTTRASAIEDHVDSHWPGWRELPVLERRFAKDGQLRHELPANYPEQWTAPGSPVRECRGDVPAGLHVPGVSPYGGWAMAVARPCPEGMHW